MVEQLVNNLEEVEKQIESYRKRLEPFYISKQHSNEKVEEAHVLMACLASFPIAINVQLLYQLWSNFKRMEDVDGHVHDLPVTVVSDFILSPLLQQTGKDLYEMDTSVRAYLLSRLQLKFGTEIIEDLASFLYKYALHFKGSDIWTNFYDAQEWTAILAMDANKAAVNILESLRTHLDANNTFESMRVANLIGAMVKDNQEFAAIIQESVNKKDVESHTEIKKTALKSRPTGKGIVLRHNGISSNGIQIDLPPGVGNRLLPVYEAESISATDARYEPERKGTVYALFVGINEFQTIDLHLTKSIEDCHKLKNILISQGLLYEQNACELFNSAATKDSVLQQLEVYLKLATHDDTILFHFCGTATLSDKLHQLCFYDYQAKDRQIISGTATHVEVREAVQRFTERQPLVVFILDTSKVGSAEWLDNLNPRHFALLACQADEEGMEAPSMTHFLVEAIQSKRFTTYKELYKHVLTKMEFQTPHFVVHPQAWDYYFLSDVKENTMMQLQQMLVSLGYKVSINGTNGPNTQRAINDFSKKYKIHNDSALLLELKKALLLKNQTSIKALCFFEKAISNSFYISEITARLKNMRVETILQPINEPITR